jgi:hypothetical protein
VNAEGEVIHYHETWPFVLRTTQLLLDLIQEIRGLSSIVTSDPVSRHCVRSPLCPQLSGKTGTTDEMMRERVNFIARNYTENKMLT